MAPTHSLPSGRYSLLGPDFHRGSHQLCLAHLLDYLVSAQQERSRDRQANRLGGIDGGASQSFLWILYVTLIGFFAVRGRSWRAGLQSPAGR